MKEKIYIWGTGKIAEEVLNDCKNLSEYEILGFIDNNPDKEGCTFFQKTIYNFMKTNKNAICFFKI